MADLFLVGLQTVVRGELVALSISDARADVLAPEIALDIGRASHPIRIACQVSFSLLGSIPITLRAAVWQQTQQLPGFSACHQVVRGLALIRLAPEIASRK